MCIKALIAFGADLHQTNDNRKTALDIAQEDSIVELLHKLGGKKGTGNKKAIYSQNSTYEIPCSENDSIEISKEVKYKRGCQ